MMPWLEHPSLGTLAQLPLPEWFLAGKKRGEVPCPWYVYPNKYAGPQRLEAARMYVSYRPRSKSVSVAFCFWAQHRVIHGNM